MIRMLVEAHKRPDLEDDVFYDRWRVEHGDLVRDSAQAMGFLRYIQSHRVASPEIDAFAAGRGWAAPADGQAELWWASVSAMEKALGSPAGEAANALLEIDERAFTDPSALSAFLTSEETIFDFTAELPPHWRSSSVKMVVKVWKKAGLSSEQFSQRWRVDHGDLVRSLAGPMGFVRYVQNHRQDDGFDFAAMRGWQPAPDGVSEIWWESAAAMTAALSSPEGQKASAILASDEAEFVDGSRITAFLAKEVCIFDHTGLTAF